MMNFLRQWLCSDRGNRMQLDVDLTSTDDIRRVMAMLRKVIPEEERYFTVDDFGIHFRPPHKTVIPPDDSYAIIIDGYIKEVNRTEHPKLFKLFDYLHSHPDEVESMSNRKLEALTGISKTYCGIVLKNWREHGVAEEFAGLEVDHESDL